MCLTLLFCQLSPVGDANGFSNNFCNVNTNGFPSPCGVWVVSGRACGSSGPRSFRPLAGCGLFLRFTASKSVPCVSVPLRGVGCFDMRIAMSCALAFPSPCGVWVVSSYCKASCIRFLVSVPLRGVGCFMSIAIGRVAQSGFPSPCGVWVVSRSYSRSIRKPGFPSLCGVWVVSEYNKGNAIWKEFPSPCGVWVVSYWDGACAVEQLFPSPCGVWVVSGVK